MALFPSVVAHFVAGALLLFGLRRRPAIGAVVGLVVLAATAVTVASRGIGAKEPVAETVGWLSTLGFDLSFRLDGFAVLMSLVVLVLGFGVLLYSLAYFDHDATYSRFVGLFMAFAGSMTGLVLASDLFTMFVFWELTSVCSFLLIGLNDRSESARQSAVRALLVTGAGGLCLLGGVGILQVELGTTSFGELARLQPTGALMNAAMVLVLLGAFTKSAQFPFHFWLPGAMAAPTPVSAYLHSATMVKAGIVLLARTSPAFGQSGLWRWWVVLAGVVTMVVGGWRALRQTDAKLLLAHSTVSQLGLLTVLVGIGSPVALYAGVAHLLAHAVFKVALFLGIGVIDHEIGTREVTRLGEARARAPFVVAAIGASTLSMAGVIPLFGFVTKEKALVALLDADFGAVGGVALAGVVLGSVLSVAYSVRLLHALVVRPVGRGVQHDDAGHHGSVASRLALGAPVVTAATASILFGLFASVVGGWLAAPAKSLDVAAKGKLLLWAGVNTALLISVAVIAVGAVIGWRAPLAVTGHRGSRGERTFDTVYDATLAASKRITRVTQPGSLPLYVTVTVLIVAAVAGASLITGGMPAFDGFVADSPLTIAVTLLTVVVSVGVAAVSLRFTAAVFLGGVGYGVAVLFLMRGAPDLALTQVLVETLTIVIFLLAMRSMPRSFAPAPSWAPVPVRVAVSVAVGVVIPLLVMAVHGARTAPSVAEDYFARSVGEAGGANVVNVILVDFRGFDTMGEITVLAVAALGVVNLVRAAERHRRPAAAGGTSPDTTAQAAGEGMRGCSAVP
ncbi:MAG: hydrogen gas-evolving membrane-bound hydrogenase subunit E [Acidimicrobiales bacterium]